ncbi:MAG: TraR/DksA C4-type zinc finger protein [Dehalococcoidales bacterium]|nr:MAG: TraR/DksA C4-type zinc finger protein [Dehalococcoidales bacterium]
MTRETDFSEVIKFHGHTCPGVTIGYRMAKAAMKRLSGKRSEDEEIVAIVENNACGVDAVQVITGCTFGKGNFIFRDYGKQVYTFYSRNTGKGFRVVFHGKGIPEEIRGNREEMTQWLLDANEEDIITVNEVEIEEPDLAQRVPSVRCEYCGEMVMETRTEKKDGKVMCISCLNR